YLNYWVGSSLQAEDPFDQMEYVLTEQGAPEYEARLQGMEYKASEAFLNALHNYGIWLGREGMRFVSIHFRDQELITAKQMKEKFYSYDQSLSLSNRIMLLQEWLLDELALLERVERNANWVEEELKIGRESCRERAEV